MIPAPVPDTEAQETVGQQGADPDAQTGAGKAGGMNARAVNWQMLERAAKLLTLAILLAILFGTLMPPKKIPLDVPGSDKLHHFAAFAALVLPLSVLNPRRALALVVAAVLIGVCIELVQPYFGRLRSLGDIIANTLGALFGAAVAWVLNRPVRRLLAR